MKPNSANVQPKTRSRIARSVRIWEKAITGILISRGTGVFAVLCMLSFVTFSNFSGTFSSAAGGNTSIRASGSHSYDAVIVKDCAARLPSGGVTTATKVKAVKVEYLSWMFDAESAFKSLRAYPPVRVMHAFKRPAVLLDVGANVGKISFPTLAMPQKHTVIAVEPVKKNMDILCKTADLNHHTTNPKLILVQGALSDADSTFQIYVPEGREDNSAISSDAATANVHVPSHAETIRTISGDNFLNTMGLEPDVIKIDVQGHELAVLKGLRRYLGSATKKVLVIAESDPKLMKKSGVDPNDIYDLMVKELGYSAYYHLEVEDVAGTLQGTGEVMEEDVYPTRTVRDIYYYKQ